MHNICCHPAIYRINGGWYSINAAVARKLNLSCGVILTMEFVTGVVLAIASCLTKKEPTTSMPFELGRYTALKSQFHKLIADNAMLSTVGKRHDAISRMLSSFLHYKAYATRLVRDIYKK